MKLRIPLLFIVLGIVGCTNSTIESTQASFRTISPITAILPTETLRFSKDDTRMQAKILFTNTTEKPLRCVRSPDGGSVGLLTEAIYRDGKLVLPFASKDVIALDAKDVFNIEPGRSALHQIEIRELISELRPGKFELRLRYHVQKGSKYDTKFGLTVIELKQIIPLIIE